MDYREYYAKGFADDGARAEIGELLWALGWKDIVGGVNGVPTVQQFNEVCGRIDRKANELRENKLDLDGDASLLRVGDKLLANYIADIGAKEILFEMAGVRENIKSGETLGTILGKIQRFFADLKPNVYKEADDPFVLMTPSTYIPVGQRTKGSLYALQTDLQGIVIDLYNRFVNGQENPPVERTIYAVEQETQTAGAYDGKIHIGRCANLVLIEPDDTRQREELALYAVSTAERGW